MLCSCVTKKRITPVGKQPLNHLRHKLSSAAYLHMFLFARFNVTQKATGVSKGICHLARHLRESKISRGTFKFARRILQSLDLVRLQQRTPRLISHPAPGCALPSQRVISAALIPSPSDPCIYNRRSRSEEKAPVSPSC